MNTFLFDKYINGSLTADEQDELEILLQDEDTQREFVEYTVEISSYVSMLKKLKTEPKRKVKKQPKVLRLLILGAAATLAVFFYLNLEKFRSFSIDGQSVSLNERIYSKSEKVLTALDGSKLFLKPGTEIEILNIDPVEIRLHRGELRANIMPQESSFKIFSGATVTNVIGTRFKLLKSDTLVDLFVEEGKVSFGTEKENMVFEAGEAGRFHKGGLVRLDSQYKSWYDWSREYSQRNDVLVYLNFADRDHLNNIAESTKEKLKFIKKYGAYAEGRWSEKMAIKDGGLESIDNVALGIHQEFTVWSWTKLNKEERIYPPILNADKPEWRLQFSQKGNFIHAGHNTKVVDGEISLEKNQWQFMAITFTNKEARCYVNGQLDVIMPGEKFEVLPKSLKIGFYKQKNLFRIFNGLIDELAIQKGALSQQQILELYEATKLD